MEVNKTYVSAHVNKEKYFLLKDWIEGQMSYNVTGKKQWKQGYVRINVGTVSPKDIWTMNAKTTLVPFWVLVKAMKCPLNILTDAK